MAVPKSMGIYVLGCFESRVTIYSQQVRALNLIHALFEQEKLVKGSRLLLVGGGVAGLTAAAGAAMRGCEVTVLEQRNDLMHLIKGSDTRWVHPHIYDWPRDGSEEPDAGLPLLNWQADQASRVRKQLELQWKALANTYKIDVICGVSRIDLGELTERKHSVSWFARCTQDDDFDVVILAMGFGVEKTVSSLLLVSYWEPDRHGTHSRAGTSKRYLISGCGDGGLLDLLRVRLDEFRVDLAVKEFLDVPELAGLKKEVLQIEQAARNKDEIDRAKFVSRAYRNLGGAASLNQRVLDRLRRDTRAVLNGPTQFPLSLNSSILNRLLASRLLYLSDAGVEIRSGELKSVTPHAPFEVVFDGGSKESFEEVIIRHGADPALKIGFPAIWNACEPLRNRNVLDQTREPLWKQGDFGEAPRPSRNMQRSDAKEIIYIHDCLLPDYFSGRTQEIERLRTLLSGEHDKTSNPVSVVAVHALGGMGKSTLVRRVLEDFGKQSRFERAVWFSFYEAGRRDAGSFFKALLERIAPNAIPSQTGLEGEEQVNKFRETLTRVLDDSPLLLILDGLEVIQETHDSDSPNYGRIISTHEQIAEFITHLCNKKSSLCIITSRVPLTNLEGASGYSAFPLDTVSMETSIEILRGIGVTGTDSDLQPFAEALGGHPLCLQAAGRYMKLRRIPASRFEEVIVNPRVFKADPVGQRVSRIVDAYRSLLSTDERHFLQMLSIHPRSVTEKNFSALVRDYGQGERNARWVRDEIIDPLAMLGLIEVLEHASDEVSYSAHPLMKLAFSAWFDPSGNRKAHEAWARAALVAPDLAQMEAAKSMKDLLPYLDAVEHYLEAGSLTRRGKSSAGESCTNVWII